MTMFYTLFLSKVESNVEKDINSIQQVTSGNRIRVGEANSSFVICVVSSVNVAFSQFETYAILIKI